MIHKYSFCSVEVITEFITRKYSQKRANSKQYCISTVWIRKQEKKR